MMRVVIVADGSADIRRAERLADIGVIRRPGPVEWAS